MSKKLECREGNGIKLFINPESNYGLTEYKPKSKDARDYERCIKRAELLQEELNEEGFIKIGRIDDPIILKGKRAEAFIKCVTCAAEKVNNFERYCSRCENWFKNISEEGE